MATQDFTPSLSKAQLRKLARQTLARCPQKQHQHLSASLTQILTEALKAHFPNALRIATFSALPHEPELSLLSSLLPERQFLYPLVLNDEMMSFHLVTDPTTLEKGAFNILEPNPQIHPPVSAKELDLLLVPGLAFDLKGNRLGQGKGYYDRYLQQIPDTPTIGISFGTQLLPSLPSEPHDRPLSHLLSERGFLTTNSPPNNHSKKT